MRKLSLTFIFILFITQVLFSQSNLVWKFQTKGRIYSTAVISSKFVLFGSGDSSFYALDKETGERIWQFITGGTIHSDAAIANESVFFGSSDSYIYSLNINTGKLNWKFKTGTEKMLDIWDYYISSPVVKDENVYYGSGDGNLYAINCLTGKLNWKFYSGHIIHAKPAIAGDKLYVGDFGGYFYAIDTKTGKLSWQFRTVGDTYFPNGEIQKAAVYNDSILYVGSRDFNIYAIDAKTGRAHWNMKETGSWIISTPFIFKDYVYYGTSDTHRFYCANKNDGVIKWKIELPMRVYGSAVEYNNVIYFGCFDGILRGVDFETGELNWQFKTLASEQNYHKVYTSEGHFRENFKLYGENYMEAEKMIHNLGSILSTPVIDNKTIYFGSSDGYLYEVKID